MSGTSGQATRAGIREASGTGSTAPPSHSGSSIPTLVPLPLDVVKLLQSQRVARKGPKYNIFKAIFQAKEGIVSHLNAKGLDTATFNAIPFGSTLRPASGYMVNFLSEFLYNVVAALKRISLPALGFNGLTTTLQRIVTRVSVTVGHAEQIAAMELQAKFLNQHLTVELEERDRKFLENGYLPINLKMRKCLHCGLPTVNELNSNRIMAVANRDKHARHQQQLASDQATEAAGSAVLNNREEHMQPGRKQNKPRYNPLIMNCHAGQCSCTTNEGPMPASDCPIGCIDEATG